MNSIQQNPLEPLLSCLLLKTKSPFKKVADHPVICVAEYVWQSRTPSVTVSRLAKVAFQEKNKSSVRQEEGNVREREREVWNTADPHTGAREHRDRKGQVPRAPSRSCPGHLLSFCQIPPP